MKRGRLEGEVQAGIIGYLSLRPDVFFWRSNTGAMQTRTGGFMRFGMRGQPDILCVQAPYGQLIGIEVKRETGGTVSPDQKRWGEKLKRFGGQYVVARSVADVAAALGEPLR